MPKNTWQEPKILPPKNFVFFKNTWIEYAMKHRTAPNQRSRANPPNKFWQNFTHSIIESRMNQTRIIFNVDRRDVKPGVVGGGVRALGP